jgi:hypothetical protein
VSTFKSTLCYNPKGQEHNIHRRENAELHTPTNNWRRPTVHVCLQKDANIIMYYYASSTVCSAGRPQNNVGTKQVVTVSERQATNCIGHTGRSGAGHTAVTPHRTICRCTPDRRFYSLLDVVVNNRIKHLPITEYGRPIHNRSF